MKKKLITLGMAVCLAAALTGCGGASAETTAAATTAGSKAEETTKAGESAKAEETTGAAAGGKLTMATNAEFPPYEFYEGGKIVGIDAEIAAAIAKEMGMELEIEDIAFDSIIPAIQSGKADFGAAGMTIDEDRKKNVDFSDTYAQASQVIIVKEGSEITNPDGLTGKTVGVQLGTTGDLYAEDIESVTLERYNKGFEAVQALLQDKVDAVVIDREPAKIFVKESAGLKILDETFTEEEYAIAVKKGNTEILTGINNALAKLKESGELQAIVDKYITAE